MSTRISPTALRLNYYNSFDNKYFYNFENQVYDYSNTLVLNNFLFTFLQNELSFLRFKVLRIRILPNLNNRLWVNVLVLSNLDKLHLVKPRRLKKFMRKFRASAFFLINKRLLKRTLRKLRKFFIKYTYYKKLRFRPKFFKKLHSSVKQLKILCLNVKRIFKLFHRFKKQFIMKCIKLCSKKISNIPTWKNILLFALLTRITVLRNQANKIAFTYSKKGILKLKKSQKIFKKKNVIIGKKKKKVLRRFTKWAFLENIKFFFKFYSFFLRARLQQLFAARSITIKYVLQRLLRHAFNKDVRISFSQISLRNKIKLRTVDSNLLLSNFKEASFITGAATPTQKQLFLRKKLWFSRRNLQNVYTKVVRLVKKETNNFTHKRLYQKYKNYKKKYTYMLYALHQGDAKLFNYAFCAMFKYLKHHKKFLDFITNQLSNHMSLGFFKNRIAGLVIRIKGKLNGNDRRKTFYIKIGQALKPQFLSNKIVYNLSSVDTFTGTFGVRVWFRLK